MNHPLFLLCFLVSLLPISITAQTGGSSLKNRPNNNASDVVSDDEDAVVLQYKISKFGIRLEPTKYEISDDMVASMLTPVIEETLYDALGGEYTQSRYILLAQAFVESDNRRDLKFQEIETGNHTLVESNSNSTTIIVKGGLVSFRSQPPVDEIPGVIETGINENFVAKLPDYIVFDGITSAAYVPLGVTQPIVEEEVQDPNDKPFDSEMQPPLRGSINNDLSTSSGGDGSSDILFIVMIASACVLLVMGLAVSYRKIQAVHDQDAEDEKFVRESSFVTTQSHEDENQSLPDENRSLPDTSLPRSARSVKEEDSKSTNSSRTTATTETQTKRYVAQSQYLAAEETFHRNSLMAIKKDMLQSEWSTYKPSNSIPRLPSDTDSNGDESNHMFVDDSDSD